MTQAGPFDMSDSEIGFVVGSTHTCCQVVKGLHLGISPLSFPFHIFRFCSTFVILHRCIICTHAVWIAGPGADDFIVHVCVQHLSYLLCGTLLDFGVSFRDSS